MTVIDKCQLAFTVLQAQKLDYQRHIYSLFILITLSNIVFEIH